MKGKDYTKKEAKKATRSVLNNFYLNQLRNLSCCESLARLNEERTEATLPDGTVLECFPRGLPSTYNNITKVGDKCIANRPAPIQTGFNKKSKAYVVQRVNSGSQEDRILYIREVGDSVLYPIPRLLDADIPLFQYLAGFSSDGKNLYIGSNKVIPPNNASVDITHLEAHWIILKDIKLVPPTGNQVYGTIEYEDSSSGVIDLTQKFILNIKDRIRPPEQGQTEEPMGLSGENRIGSLFVLWPPDDSEIITKEDVIDFIQDIADFLEVSFEQALTLFPPNVLEIGYDSREDPARFNPPILEQYSEHSDAVEAEFNPPNNHDGHFILGPEERHGIWTREWEYFHDETQAVFVNVAFAFNNNEDGDTVLDVLASYKTCTVYGLVHNTYEMVEDLTTETFNIETLPDNITPSGDHYVYQNIYGKYDNVVLDYTDIWANYAWEESATNFANNYTVLRIDPTDVEDLNFYLKAEGHDSNNAYMTHQGISVPASETVGYQQYYSVLYFKKYDNAAPGGPIGPPCHGGASTVCIQGCPYYLTVGTNGSVCGGYAVLWGRFAWFSGTGPLMFGGGIWQLPMETSLFNTRKTFNNKTKELGFFVPTPQFFIPNVLPDDDPDMAGIFPAGDLIGNFFSQNVQPDLQAVQFGRGVMHINDVERNQNISGWIDRPPADSGDFDHIIAPYLGVSGGRAVLLKLDHNFGGDSYIYAYQQNYTSTNNQRIGTEPPDTFTETYFIDQGTWPFTVEFLKGYDSDDFFQYGTTGSGADIFEFVEDLTVKSNGQVEVNKQKGGSRPTNFGTVEDCVIF